MIQRVGALVLYSKQPDRAAEFYRRLGFPLTEETHEDEVRHYACEIGGVHVAIFEAGGDAPPPVRAHGATMFDFAVTSLDEILSVAEEAGGKILLGEPQEVEWGRRIILLDPDGREVQFFEPKSA
ncbi:MAG: VOC family protein [Dehalococcoidia bacterium]